MKYTMRELEATHDLTVRFPRKGDLVSGRPNHIPKGEGPWVSPSGEIYFELYKAERNITIAPMNVWTPKAT